MSAFGPQSRLRGATVPDAAQQVVNTPVAVKRRFPQMSDSPIKCRRTTDANHGKIMRHRLVLTTNGKDGFSRLNGIGVGDASGGSRFHARVDMKAPRSAAEREAYLCALEGNMRKVGVAYGAGDTRSSQDVATAVQGLVPMEVSSGTDRALEPFTKVEWQIPRPANGKEDVTAADLTFGCFAQDPDGVYPELVKVGEPGNADASRLLGTAKSCLRAAADTPFYAHPTASAAGKLIGLSNDAAFAWFGQAYREIVQWLVGKNASRELPDYGIELEGVNVRSISPFIDDEGNIRIHTTADPKTADGTVTLGGGDALTASKAGYRNNTGTVGADRRRIAAFVILDQWARVLDADKTTSRVRVVIKNFDGQAERPLSRDTSLHAAYVDWIASNVKNAAVLALGHGARTVGTVVKDDGKGNMTVLLAP